MKKLTMILFLLLAFGCDDDSPSTPTDFLTSGTWYYNYLQFPGSANPNLQLVTREITHTFTATTVTTTDRDHSLPDDARTWYWKDLTPESGVIVFSGGVEEWEVLTLNATAFDTRHGASSLRFHSHTPNP